MMRRRVQTPFFESMLPLSAMLFLTLIGWASVHVQRPPDPVPVTAPPDQFSSGRARLLLESFARAPHPTGSPEAGAVRRFVLEQLLALGLKPEIQRAETARAFPGRPFRAARIENIFARLPGSESSRVSYTKALLLAAHTDSVPHSPGASDDGAGVAALLETLRALKAGPPLKRDVIFLFTDGEELGLMGANAFIDHNPQAKNLGLVLNFEARGNGGPAYMFETSAGNGALVRGLAAAAPAPDANSLMYAVYHAIPNDTDLTLFKRAGIAGLNFAFVGGLQYYHSPGDSLDHQDERSLQHQGSYALSLARYFGSHPLPRRPQPDVIYFNGPFGGLVIYPIAWAQPIALLIAILFAVVFSGGLRRRKWTLFSATRGALCFLLLSVAGVLLVQGIWILIRMARPGTSATSQSGLYALALALLLLSAVICTLRPPDSAPSSTRPCPVADAFPLCSPVLRPLSFVLRPPSAQDLSVGALTVWLILVLLTAFKLPGASYLFAWPLLFALIGYAIVSVEPDADAGHVSPQSSLRSSIALCLALAPGVAIFCPTMYALYLLLSLLAPGILAAPAMLLIGLVLPVLDRASRAPLLAGACFIGGVLLLSIALLLSPYANGSARRDTMLYVLDASRREAFWMTTDGNLDEWTRQFLPGPPENALPRYFAFRQWAPRRFWGRFRTGPAPTVSLTPPALDWRLQSRRGRRRLLRMRIQSPRGARTAAVFIDSRIRIDSAILDGCSLQVSAGRCPFALLFTGVPPQGFDLLVSTRSPGPIRVMVVDFSDELPRLPGFTPHPRKAYLQPTLWSDQTAIIRCFTSSPSLAKT